MNRKIIQIDEEKCVGCGLCANACQQSAIEMVDGKAKVVRDDFCDGIGNCLPVCPVNAISFSDRNIVVKTDNADKSEKVTILEKPTKSEEKPLPCGCPGTHSKLLVRSDNKVATSAPSANTTAFKSVQSSKPISELRQWPVQIKLIPPNAPYFDNAHLLIAADCSAYAYANFHADFIQNKITLIGCPKLDEGDYTEKLTHIIAENNIKSVTVVRMEVPCCGGIENATVNALKASGKFIPWQVVTIGTDGSIVER